MDFDLLSLPVDISTYTHPCDYCGARDSIIFHWHELMSLPDAYHNGKLIPSNVRYKYAIHRGKKLLRIAGPYPAFYRKKLGNEIVHIRKYSYKRDGSYASISRGFFEFKDSNMTDSEILDELEQDRIRHLKEWDDTEKANEFGLNPINQ